MQPLLRELSQILAPENLLTDRAARLACSASIHFAPDQDALPLAICRPVLVSQAAQILKAASSAGMSVQIRGLGTTMASPRPEGEFILLLTTGLGRIYEIDAPNRVVHCQAGVLLPDLQKAATGYGLFYPGCARSGAAGTIGGNLAANRAFSLKYGPPAAYALDLDCLAGTGEMLACASQNWLPWHLEAGFPLAALFCGSLGCLGLIANIRLRLMPLPAAESRLFLRCPDGEATGAATAAILKAGLAPEQMLFLDPLCSAALPEPDASGWVLAIRFTGPEESAKREARLALDLALKNGATQLPDCGAMPDFARLWPALGAKSRFELFRLVCPPADLGRFLARIAAIADGLTVPLAGHADLGQIIAAVPTNSANLAKELLALELLANDCLNAEDDLKLSRPEWQNRYNPGQEFSTKLRKLFDPAGILAQAPLPGMSSHAQ